MTPLRQTTLLAVLLLLLAGCGSYSEKGESFLQPYAAGNFTEARKNVSDLAAARSKTQDRLLYALEEGAVLYWAGDARASLEAFERAERMVEEYDARADVSVRSVGSKAASLALNDTVLPYQGTAGDRILLNTYKALCYLRLGAPGDARVELRRAADRRKQSLERAGREIAAAEKQAAGKGVNLQRTLSSKEYQAAAARHYGELERLPYYKDFANPTQVWLEGLAALRRGDGRGDLAHAEALFGTCLGMTGEKALEGYVALAKDAAAGKRAVRRVHLLLEAGQAPEKVSESINLPLFLYDRFFMIHLAFPAMNLLGHAMDGARMEAGEARAPAVLLASVDAIQGRELEMRTRAVVASQLVSASLKAVAESELSKQNLLLGVAVSIFNAVETAADTRSWRTLPKEYRLACLVPGEAGTLRLATGAASREIQLPAGDGDVLIHARSVTGGDLAFFVIPL